MISQELTAKSLPWLTALLLSLGFIMVFYHLQAPVDFRAEPLNDANRYLKIYESFRIGEFPGGLSFPFNNRLLTPLLASTLRRGSPELDFFTVNSIYTVVYVLVLFEMFRRLGAQPIQYAICFLWALHWLGPFRGNAADPLNTDAGILMFQALALLFIHRQQHFLLMLVTPFAVLHKEVFVAWMIIYAAVVVMDRIMGAEPIRGFGLAIIAVLLALLTKWLAMYFFPPVELGRGSLITLLFNVRESLIHPVRLWRWLAALFAAFGVLFLPLWFLQVRIWSLNRFQVYLFLCITANTVFGILAGDDHTRILYLGSPFLFAMFAADRTISLPVWATAILISLPALGLWSRIPVRLPVVAAEWQFEPDYAGPYTLTAWLLYGTAGAILTVILHVWLRRRRKPAP